jgi:hypothetical protein
MKPWIGVDFDGTLVEYNGWQGATHVGKPVPAMVERVKVWLAEGKDVRIFTARIAEPDPLLPPEEFARSFEEVKIAIYEVKKWCLIHFGKVLPITCTKDYGMVELWDGRCVQIEPNTGRRAVDVAYSRGYNDGYYNGYGSQFEKDALENEGGITT